MFENMTYDNLMEKALASVSTDVDKREGSVIYDALAPACAEIAQLYIELENILKEGFASTADREYLIRKGMERAIFPNEAEAAVLRGVFDGYVPLESRFNLGELNYVVTEHIKNYEYKLTCETAGSEGNRHFGTLTPIDYISGITSASLVELLIPGCDEESTEDFRTRYFESINDFAFGGNRDDYKRVLKGIQGVGQTKVERTYEGGGTVRVLMLDSDGNIPSSELLWSVKTELDPSDYSGCGYGLMPIGHSVIVEEPSVVNINVSFDASVDGRTLDDMKSDIETVVKNYIASANSKWSEEGVVLYSARLLAQLLEIDGFKNITSLTMNNQQYIKLEDDEIAAIGDISCKEVEEE